MRAPAGGKNGRTDREVIGMASSSKSGTKGGAKTESRSDTTDKDRRREARTSRKESRAAMKAAKVERYRAKTRAREKAGGTGMSVVFYEVVMPDGKAVKVRKKDANKGGRKRRRRA